MSATGRRRERVVVLLRGERASLFRLMLPHLDTSSRPNYKLKQKGLANLYVDIMGLEKNSMEARTIVDWKRPSTGLQRSEQGNFPEVMYSVLKERCKPRADLRRVTVGERARALRAPGALGGRRAQARGTRLPLAPLAAIQAGPLQTEARHLFGFLRSACDEVRRNRFNCPPTSKPVSNRAASVL